jgi:hypothetical protein
VRVVRPPWQRVDKLGNHEAFFRTDRDAPGPVVVVHHIRKTAGSSLRTFVRANLSLLPVETEILSPGISKRDNGVESLTWYREWHDALGDRSRRLACVMSQTAGYLMPALDRPADLLALVREPVDRVLSYHYDHKRRQPRTARPLAALQDTYARAEEIAPGSPAHWEYFNGQSRRLLSIYYDVTQLPFTAGPGPDADLWRNRVRHIVDSVFLLGVQDRFTQYISGLARRYGWRPFVPRGKVNGARPAVFDASALWETVLSYNWLDAELYELARQAQVRREQREQQIAGEEAHGGDAARIA